MAITTILQPQDCLRRNPNSTGFVPDRNPRRDRNSVRIRRRKQSSVENAGIRSNNNSNNHVDGRRLLVARFPSNNLVMGQVRILKRGEELSMPMKIPAAVPGLVADEDFVLCSTDRLGPDPETVQKHVRLRDGIYAGPASVFGLAAPELASVSCFFRQGEEKRCRHHRFASFAAA